MRFAALGAKLIITSDQEERINAIAKKLKEIGTDVTSVVADFSKPEQVTGLVERIEMANGPIDILVNNAGVGMHALIDERPMSDFRFLFEVNFLAMASLCSQLLPLMYQRGGGRIINVSSAAGQFGSAYFSAYSASKGAMHAFSQAIRVEGLANCVYVSEVIPVSVRTPFFENARGKKYRPLGVVLTPEKVAASIVKCALSRRPRPEVWPFLGIRMVFLLNALAPGLLVKINTQTFIRNQKELGD